MGRGRAKAKQTKVARQLKYATGDLDVDALTAELGTGASEDSDDQDTDDERYSDDDRGRRQA
jgi:hypothetical protein